VDVLLKGSVDVVLRVSGGVVMRGYVGVLGYVSVVMPRKDRPRAGGVEVFLDVVAAGMLG
jgi:hypothetical protein